MEIKLTAAQVAEIVDSDERVKQAVVSLYLQRNKPLLTISDLLVGQQHISQTGGTGTTSTPAKPAPMSGGIGSSIGAGCGGAGSGGIGTLTTQQMMDACLADGITLPGTLREVITTIGRYEGDGIGLSGPSAATAKSSDPEIVEAEIDVLKDGYWLSLLGKGVGETKVVITKGEVTETISVKVEPKKSRQVEARG